MANAKVLEFLQQVAQIQRKPGRRVSDHLLLSQTHPSRSPFHGLFIAVLIAACFWAALALVILRLR